MKQHEIMSRFASVYWAAIQQYREVSQNLQTQTLTSERFKSEFYAGLKWLLKHCGTLVPPKASLNAYNLARNNGVDLHALQWKDQPHAEKFMFNEEGRKYFHHEHKIPVTVLYNEILEAKSEHAIIEVLLKQEIVWILKEENKKLPSYIREGNEYEQNNIQIIENPYGDQWLEKNWKV